MDILSVSKSPAYGELLLRTRPIVIKTRRQFDQFVGVMEGIDTKAKATAEERALSELLMSLIDQYEKSTESKLPATTPIERLKYLMEKGGLRQTDLLPIFGSRSAASQTLSGKRGLTVAMIAKLAKYFDVSPEVFISR